MSIIVVTHRSTGQEALAYQLLVHQHLISAQFFTGLKVLFPTKKRRQAAKLRDKLIQRLHILLTEAYPGSKRYEVEMLATKDIDGETVYPRYLIRVKY